MCVYLAFYTRICLYNIQLCPELIYQKDHKCKPNIISVIGSRVGVKYSCRSTQVQQVPQIYTKYKYWSSTHFFKKYLSTSSTFISSTSTSTHIKIGPKVRMDIQSRVNFGWTKQKSFPQIMSLLKSQNGHILCREDLGWTK